MVKKNSSASLIISTYNWPEALNLCLLSIKEQQIMPDEVIIADDGSGEDTQKLIQKYQRDFPVPLHHIWQPDEGFQLAKIRNKAIAAARSEYIIQVDGDLILHPQFIADHIDFSKKGSFVTGSRVILDENLSAYLLDNEKVKVNRLSKGISNRPNSFRIKFLRNYLADRYKNRDIFYLRGCNMAFWRKDLITVNGYNEEFIGWGREDNEIAARLMNVGIQKRSLKFGGVVFHIYHQEKSRLDFVENELRLENAIKNKETYCSNGLHQYL